MHCRVCARASKIDEKSHRIRFSSDSRHRGLLTDDFFGFRSAEMVSEVSLGRLGRPPGAPLALSWPPTGPSWRALGPSLGALGPLLGALGALLATLLHANSLNFVCWSRFSSIWAPSGHENLRKAAKNLRNQCENLRPAPRIKRRIPTRVRRSREANSIRRTLAFTTGSEAFKTLCRMPNSWGACLPLPLHWPPRVRRTPPWDDSFLECANFFAFDSQSLLLRRS